MQVVGEDGTTALVDETIRAIIELTKKSLQRWVEKAQEPSGSVIDATTTRPTRHVAVTWASFLELAMSATSPQFQDKLVEFSVELSKTEVKASSALHEEYMTMKQEQLWTSHRASLGYYLWYELQQTADTQVFYDPDFSTAQHTRIVKLVTFAAKFVSKTKGRPIGSSGAVLTWAISKHIAPVIQPTQNKPWQNKGQPKLPESLVQAACIWIDECYMTLWAEAVRINDYTARAGRDPHAPCELDYLCVANFSSWRNGLGRIIRAQESRRGNKWMRDRKKLSDANFDLLCNANLGMWMACETEIMTKDINWRKKRDEMLEADEAAGW